MAGENQQVVEQALRKGFRVVNHNHHNDDQTQSSQKSVAAALASSFPTPLPGRNRAYSNGNYYSRHRILADHLNNNQPPPAYNIARQP